MLDVKAQLPPQDMFVPLKLVAVQAQTFDLEIDLKYATVENITGKRIYRQPVCYIREEVVQPLQTAVRLARQIGLRLRIFDAYRPPQAQQLLWQACPDERYIVPPHVGSNHTRGIALDVTLCTPPGEPLDMGTAFDAMQNQSHHGSADIAKQAQHNRFVLRGLMATAGFETLPSEWWHYQLPGDNWPLVNQLLLTTKL